MRRMFTLNASVAEMAAQLFPCIICLSEVQPKHATTLFSDVGLQQDWPSRLCELLLTPVDRGNDLPAHTCCSGVGKVETLEHKDTQEASLGER